MRRDERQARRAPSSLVYTAEDVRRVLVSVRGADARLEVVDAGSLRTQLKMRVAVIEAALRRLHRAGIVERVRLPNGETYYHLKTP